MASSPSTAHFVGVAEAFDDPSDTLRNVAEGLIGIRPFRDRSPIFGKGLQAGEWSGFPIHRLQDDRHNPRLSKPVTLQRPRHLDGVRPVGAPEQHQPPETLVGTEMEPGTSRHEAAARLQPVRLEVGRALHVTP